MQNPAVQISKQTWNVPWLKMATDFKQAPNLGVKQLSPQRSRMFVTVLAQYADLWESA